MSRVYFIKPVGMDGPVKIGCSHRPDGRLSALEAWSPFPLEVAAQIHGGMTLERRFHALFADQHSHREWFRPSPELTRVIALVASGEFDISTLPEPRSLYRNRKGRTGMKWTPEQRAAVLFSNALRRAERQSGLTYDWVWDHDKKQSFINDPLKVGITRAERDARVTRRRAEYAQATADAERRVAEIVRAQVQS